MKEGNVSEFWYAYHVYHKNGMLPSVFANLPRKERAMLIAFIDIEAERIEKENKKYKK